MLLLILVSKLPRLGPKAASGDGLRPVALGERTEFSKKKQAELVDKSLGGQAGEDWSKLRPAGASEIRDPY